MRCDDVKQAVEFLDGWDIDAAWVDAACAALREWLEQQEQKPDYEAAKREMQRQNRGSGDDGKDMLGVVLIVDVALGKAAEWPQTSEVSIGEETP